jgi:hypothetical protein
VLLENPSGVLVICIERPAYTTPAPATTWWWMAGWRVLLVACLLVGCILLVLGGARGVP